MNSDREGIVLNAEIDSWLTYAAWLWWLNRSTAVDKTLKMRVGEREVVIISTENIWMTLFFVKELQYFLESTIKRHYSFKALNGEKNK